jgi:hypothetical protein
VVRKVTVHLIDDIDGSVARETIEFCLDGVSYRIDLSSGNARKIRDVLAGYVRHARRSVLRGDVAMHGMTRSAAADREQNRGIREWARKRGLHVSDRGRISAEVLDAYRQAN